MHLVDALANEKQYEIRGAAPIEERAFAEDLVGEGDKLSDVRLVQMRLFRSGAGPEARLLAIIRYFYLGANPARCCMAIGKVVLLNRTGNQALATVRQSPHAYTTFTNIQPIADLRTGRSILLVGLDFGAPETTGEYSMILGVERDRLIPLHGFVSAISTTAEDGPQTFAMTLDRGRTHFGTDRRLWFVKKTFMRGMKILDPPEAQHVAIKVGTNPVDLDW
ncbi:MAG: hypothetical protein WDO18_16985 [Acidobacteriota bacterium]